jgi:hypothetical protein
VSSTAIHDAIERDVAAADDADTGEPEAAEVEQVEQAPAEQPPMGAKELAALGKKIDAENDRHEKRLRELYGDAFEEMRDCPLCMSEGFVPPLSAETMPPEQVAAVHAALGENQAPDLLGARDTEMCEDCDGHGLVRTHSKRDEHLTKNCATCAGRGFIETAGKVQPYPQPQPVPMPYSNGQPPPPVFGEVDQWSRPAGHRHFGVDPAILP